MDYGERVSENNLFICIKGYMGKYRRKYLYNPLLYVLVWAELKLQSRSILTYGKNLAT